MRERGRGMITLLQLKYFHELARTEHLTQTAQRLYLSQTALSSMIINMEKELDIRLFERTGRKLRLSQAGKTYLQYVDQALCALDNGRAALEDIKEQGEREVTLGMGSSHVWTPLLKAFRNRCPTLSIRQSNHTAQQMREKLDSMELDYAIASTEDFPQNDLEHAVFRQDKIYLCVPQSHPLAMRTSVSMAELAGESFIGLSSGVPFRRFCDAMFERCGLPCNVILECDYTVRAQLIEAGFGVALTTGTAYDAGLLLPNVHIPLSDECARRTMALIWNPRKYRTRAATTFRDFCIRFYQDRDQPAPPQQ